MDITVVFIIILVVVIFIYYMSINKTEKMIQYVDDNGKEKFALLGDNSIDLIDREHNYVQTEIDVDTLFVPYPKKVKIYDVPFNPEKIKCQKKYKLYKNGKCYDIKPTQLYQCDKENQIEIDRWCVETTN